VRRCRDLWQEVEGAELGAVQQVGGSEDQGPVAEQGPRRWNGSMYLWKEIGSTSRCTLARRDQSQVHRGRRYQEEVVVYGQTQRIKFGRILVI
jgi:hypothetical protein